LKEFGTLENVLANADTLKGALGEKVRNNKELAILSKKLATIITNVPVSFHEEDFKLKEWNNTELVQVFTELEFKTLGKRILGEAFNAFQSVPQAGQMDLFGNPVVTEEKKTKTVETKETNTEEEEEQTTGLSADKNIHNTAHNYQLIQGPAIAAFVQKLMAEKEICFDTETTNIDANEADLVGLSFSIKPTEGYYIPCPADRKETEAILAQLQPLFEKQTFFGWDKISNTIY